MLVTPKFKGYQDVQRKIILRADIEGITPYEITLPEPPKPENIINFGLPIEQQVFKKEIIPPWVWKLTQMANTPGKSGRSKREEANKIIRATPEYANFVEDQWRKRQEGIWVYIRGVPTYITKRHWHYCNYYYMDDGLPNYRYVDAEYYYWWDLYVVENPNVYGGIEMTIRRDGKSYRGGNTMLFDTTESKNFNVGMLSKTSEDSKDLFQRVIVLPWKRLPIYFSPKYDNKSYPVKEINFRDPDSNIEFDEWSLMEQITTNELNSTIEARASVHTAFDGAKLKRFFLDEAGKTEEMLVSQTWRVHKQCLRVLHEIIGKALITSTVEETTKGGLVEFKKIWNESDHDPSKLTLLGQTKSGLVRYFKPAYETMRIDQYGNSVINDPEDFQREYFERNPRAFPHPDKGGKELIDMEISDQTDPVERQKFIHMYPRTVREALTSNPKDCEFNAINIQQRLADFIYGNDEVVYGNLYWEDDIRFGTIKWREDAGGRWAFKKSLLPYILANANNVTTTSAGNYMPGNSHWGCIGADPYKYNATNTDRRSLGTAMGYMNYNVAAEDFLGDEYDEPQSEDFFFLYAWRHMDKKKYNEDVLMTCWFLGMPLFPEINVSSLWDYMVDNHMEHFLKYRNIIKKRKHGSGVRFEKSKTPGMTTLGDVVKEPIFALVGTYIDTLCHKCVFEPFLNDCRDVEYKDWSPYDNFVSGGYALYGSKGIRRAERSDEPNPVSFDGMWNPTVVR